jgi:ribosome-associated toxin RatA of RatAB toxin-antitoxin module
MRNVKLSMRVAVDAGSCFDRISDFAIYPQFVNVIRAVTVYLPEADEPKRSDWEVYFRNGILRWSEQDELDRAELRIRFEQTDGDFDHFTGQWILDQDADNSDSCVVTFDSDFDFGIPSLAGILDPVAERVFKETIARVVTGLFGNVEVIGDPAVTRVLAQEQRPVPADSLTAGVA